MRMCHWIVLGLVLHLFTGMCGAAENGKPGDGGKYWEVTFEASQVPGELIYGAYWRIWIPDAVQTLRGVVVHQHGCGDGSAKPGHTGVEDWHWQTLARKHNCALMAVSYRQNGPCEMWCDPRNGSAKSFLNALDTFAEMTGHAELTVVPWAVWGHSGGGHWTASMCQLYPERMLCAWLRSGHPDTVGSDFKELPLTEKIQDVPMILNLGIREKTEFKRIWDTGFPYVHEMRRAGAKIAIFMDPKTGHCSGDSRYPAIRFLDICMEQRLPEKAGTAAVRPMTGGLVISGDEIWAEYSQMEELRETPETASLLVGEKLKPYLAEGYWLPTPDFAALRRQYEKDCSFTDTTPPPAPFDVKTVWTDGADSSEKQVEITWNAYADLESGLSAFVVERDGKEIAVLTGNPHSVATPLYQGLLYSDTPHVPSVEKKFTETVKTAASAPLPVYSVRSVNSRGMKSESVPGK